MMDFTHMQSWESYFTKVIAINYYILLVTFMKK